MFSINRQVRKCSPLGLAAVKRTTLADANQPRPAIIFKKTYYQLYELNPGWEASKLFIDRYNPDCRITSGNGDSYLDDTKNLEINAC